MRILMKHLVFLTALLCPPVSAGNASDSKLLQLVIPAMLAAPRWRTPQRISDNAGDADLPQIAVNAAGNAIAVWQQSDGTYIHIWANRYEPGNGWTSAQLIETDSAGDAISPQVGIDSAGNATAVWDQSDAGLYQIWANRYTADATWGTPQLIDPFAVCLTIRSESAWYPQVAVNPTGNVIAVWNKSDGTSLHVCANRYDADKGWGTAQLIEPDGTTSVYPQTAIDSAGNAVVVWSYWDGTQSDIEAHRYVVESGWDQPQLISSGSDDDVGDAQLAVDAIGNAIAVWHQYDGTYYHVWANRYVAGSGWGTAQLIEPNSSKNTTFSQVQVAVDSAGNAIAVWTQGENNHPHIWANRYVAGSGWGTAQLIETEDTGFAQNPQVAIDSAGHAVAVWEHSNGTLSNIWANRYVVGSGWGTAKIIDSGNNTGGCLHPQVAIDAKGRGIAVWQQWDATGPNAWTPNIWAARYE